MEEDARDSSISRLQNLQQDLEFLAHDRLPNLERLVLELQSSIEDFRNLLTSKPRNDVSRQKLNSGKFESDGVEYSVNDEFKQRALQIADALNIDEIEAAVLFLHGQAQTQSYDRPDYWCAINLYHQRRQVLLSCLQQSLGFASLEDLDEEVQGLFKDVTTQVTHAAGAQPTGGKSYLRKCIDSMSDIEKNLQSIAETLQRIALTNQVQSEVDIELFNLQRESLIRQHELLSAIVTDLCKANFATVEDLRVLVARLQTFDRYDVTLVHYIPCFASMIVTFGSSDAYCSSQDAESLNSLITSLKDHDAWKIRSLQAAATSLWLAHYSARFNDLLLAASEAQQKELEKQMEVMDKRFMEGLRDGALQFILATCQALRRDGFHDPARKEWFDYLMGEISHLQLDNWKFEKEFKRRLAQGYQLFAEAFITNMPDTLRMLKFEEDEQRRQLQSRIQLRPTEYELHLERFLTLIGYAYENDADAAGAFWADSDSNLFGFLQWASMRQTTPRVAAFCEMLKGLACGEENSDTANTFLLDESYASASRQRRNSPLSWYHIYNELDYFTQSIKDKLTLNPTSTVVTNERGQADLIVESETGIMLQSYLNLIAHFARNSPRARAQFWSTTSFDMQDHLLNLCSSSIDSRLRSCAFNALAALLTGKNRDIQNRAWTALDGWVSGGANFPRPPAAGSNITSGQLIFEIISSGFDETNSFVNYLYELIIPPLDDPGMVDLLPFPDSLGSSYRMPGIEPYVDFVMERAFSRKLLELSDEHQVQTLRLSCLRFALESLSSFNEDLVVHLKKTGPSGDQAQEDSQLGAYIRMHPLARVMEWLFNDGVLFSLFATAIQDEDQVNRADPDSLLIEGLTCAVEVIERTFELQTTYFGIVRPVIKLSSSMRHRTIANSAIVSFDDAVLNKLELIPHLGFYATSGHQRLAIVSLNLLKRLSSSRRLNSPISENGTRTFGKTKMLSALENGHNAERISRAMFSTLIFDPQQLVAGEEAPSYQMKLCTLSFLRQSLEASPKRPNIAHLLLGFQSEGGTLQPGTAMLEGNSLLHVIMGLALQYPDSVDGSYYGWLLRLRNEALQILRQTWRSPLTKGFVIPELRTNEFLQGLEQRREPISSDIAWNNSRMADPLFFSSEIGGGQAVSLSLRLRAAFLDYAAVECLDSKQKGLISLSSHIQESLLSPPVSSGGQGGRSTILDMLDFLELPDPSPIPLPQSKFFDSIDFDLYAIEDDMEQTRHEVRAVKQMLTMHENSWLMRTPIRGTPEEELMRADTENIMQCLDINNNRVDIYSARAAALYSWVQLVIVVLQCCELEPSQKHALIAQILQATLARFEASLFNDKGTADILALLMTSLLSATDFSLASTSESPKNADLADDRFFQLMRLGLAGIRRSDITTELREKCCQIVHAYLRGIAKGQSHSGARHFALQSVRSGGQGVIESLCDDVYSGEGSTRISALLLLASLVVIANAQASKYVVESFNRINFVQVLVGGLRDLPEEASAVQASASSALPALLAYHDLSLSLLLCISQSRLGAASILSSDFFGSVHASGLFEADPDIGLAVDDPAALRKFFDLLLGALRIISAMIISQEDNEQILAHVRGFLRTYRPSIVSLFKRHAGIGTTGKENGEVIADIVDNLTFLVSATGFLDTEEEAKGRREVTFTQFS